MIRKKIVLGSLLAFAGVIVGCASVNLSCPAVPGPPHGADGPSNGGGDVGLPGGCAPDQCIKALRAAGKDVTCLTAYCVVPFGSLSGSPTCEYAASMTSTCRCAPGETRPCLVGTGTQTCQKDSSTESHWNPQNCPP